ncbi:MAG TPA: hypothetical protein VHV51_18630 [Polyangiaceae bacterium]|nr:hypothetical protein [Polyangiaceae bacterium]
MLLAVLVAISSMMLGAALSFAPNSRGVLGYLRTFATLAALAVVVTHLLPEALFELGPVSILLFLAGWFAPVLAHFVGQRSTSGRSAPAVLEAGYWGLMIHHVADGIGLGTYTRLPSATGSHFDVVIALAAHTVPLIAVVALAYRVTFGLRAALVRSCGLALATLFGIALSSLVAAQTIEHFSPLISAIAAGLLLHVVTHDLTEDPPRGFVARTLDLVVAAGGVGVSLLGVERGADPAMWLFSERLLSLVERSSLVVLVGLAAAALSLRLADRSSKAALAILPAAPLGADALLLGISLYGFTSTALRVGTSALGLALLPALPNAETDSAKQAWWSRVSQALARSGPWLILGALLGALLSTVPASALSRNLSGSALELGLFALIANVVPLAAPAALLVAMGLTSLGVSSGAELLFVTLGPLLVRQKLTLKTRALLTAICLLVAWLSNLLHISSAPLDGALSASEPGLRFAIALGVLLLFGIWQHGARIWLSAIVKTPAHEHEHAHDVHGPHSAEHTHEHGGRDSAPF